MLSDNVFYFRISRKYNFVSNGNISCFNSGTFELEYKKIFHSKRTTYGKAELHKMEIAILTLSASDNCGSLLQAYALQQILIYSGHKVDILDFITKRSKKMYRIIHPGYIKQPRKLLGTFLKYRDLKEQRNDYQTFRKTYLKMSLQTFSNSSELAAIDGKYDYIICGSDQVWNTDMWDFDEAYLLKWCKLSKKAGYAVSLGDKKNNDLHKLHEKLVNIDDFFMLSVREKSAAKKLNDIFKRDTKVCLDPTLLLSYEEWKKITDQNIVPETPFIFYYSYNYEDEIKNKMVAEFSKITQLPVYVINPSRWCDGKEEKYKFHICKKSGPVAFLSLMQYCTWSLVESFHGTLFSYIFKKQFWFLKNTDDNILDDRINDIMEILDMKSQVLHPSDIIDKINNEKISYRNIPYELQKLKKESIQFISDLDKQII